MAQRVLTILTALTLGAGPAWARPAVCRDVFVSGKYEQRIANLADLYLASDTLGSVLRTKAGAAFHESLRQLEKTYGSKPVRESLRASLRGRRSKAKEPELKEEEISRSQLQALAPQKLEFTVERRFEKPFDVIAGDGSIKYRDYKEPLNFYTRIRFFEDDQPHVEIRHYECERDGREYRAPLPNLDMGVGVDNPYMKPAELQIYDAGTGDIRTLPLTRYDDTKRPNVWSVSPNGVFAASIDSQGRLHRVEISSGKNVVGKPSLLGFAKYWLFSSEAVIAIKARDDGSVRAWRASGSWVEFDKNLNPVNRGHLADLFGPEVSKFDTLKIAPGEKAAVGFLNEELLIMDFSTRESRRVKRSTWHMRIEWLERNVIAVDQNKDAMVIPLASDLPVRTLSDENFSSYFEGNRFLTTTYDRSSVTGRSGDLAVQVDNLDTGERQVIDVTDSVPKGETEILHSVSNDGRRLALTVRDPDIRGLRLVIYDVETQKPIGEKKIENIAYQDGQTGLRAPYLSPKGNFVALWVVSGGMRGTETILWRLN